MPEASLSTANDTFVYSISRTGRKCRRPAYLVNCVPTTEEGVALQVPGAVTRLDISPPTSPARANVPDSTSTTPENSTVDSSSPSSCYDTKPDRFGIFRQYSATPKHTPPDASSLSDLCDSPALQNPNHGAALSVRRAGPPNVRNAHNPFHPFSNSSVYRFMKWDLDSSGAMSRSKSQSLLDDVLFAPDFELSDLRGLNVGREWERVESSETSDPEFSAADGWNKSSVTVRLPKEKENGPTRAKRRN
ncbi:hypothetical protein WOLCODRAFT_159357 [Wolfiporia cocos MD-104 SS10]|uniref:Uncharacterized protein n=1 Tax=Wolfiporia cocos (strain MD-104) TaxID=742152 RepID=A0A2H3JJ05_WOLCO|nr:hypothetical protein WOLCODRAFT_159357 [Wolfiporia cocos MD-104 SS10]